MADPSVSRLHARLRLTANGTEIEDAGSSNGTWVNGVRLTGPKLLGERDVVRIGNAAFEYRSPEPTGVPRGGVTIVDVIGDDPSPFPAAEIPVARAPRLQPGLARQGQVQADESVAQRRPKPRLVEPLARPDGPARPGAVRSQPHSAAPSVPVGRDLEALRADLGPFTERLQRLAELLDNTPTGNGGALPAELQSLIRELEQHGGRERFARVQQLLDDLVGAPTDVRLLVRLADELPLLIRLIDFYLRALSLVRQTGE